jgi:hypothetical protein
MLSSLLIYGTTIIAPWILDSLTLPNILERASPICQFQSHINATGFTIGSFQSKINIDLDVHSIADSGASLMVIDDAVLDVSRGAVMIPPSYLNFRTTDYNTLQCYGSLQSNAGLNLSIYVITFLKSVFVVFDDENKRIGITPKYLVL